MKEERARRLRLAYQKARDRAAGRRPLLADIALRTPQTAYSRGTQDILLRGERDVPYLHRALSLKHGASVKAREMSGKRDILTAGISRERVQPILDVMLLFIGCVLIAGFVWQFRELGVSFQALEPLVGRATAAYHRFLDAKSALAERNFSGGEAAFTDAAVLMADLRRDFDAMLDSSRVLLGHADVTGTVSSGRELLTAAEALARAGQHLSRGLAPLFTAGSLLGEDTATLQLSLVEALEVAHQELTSASVLLNEADVALHRVESPFFPTQIKNHVDALGVLTPRINSGLRFFLDRSQVLWSALGGEREMQYLLLFENNNELRPTGGFIGSFALVDVDRGVVEDIDVQSIYDSDGQLKKFVAPPEPLLRVAPRWYMRDANWFVDYATSARKIAEFFEQEGGPTVDGVISFTPEIIRDLLRITGPLAMPAYDVTVTAENFVQVASDQVTYSYNRQHNKPKQFLADLVPVLLNRLFAQSHNSILPILQTVQAAAQQKNLLVYFRDKELQRHVEAVGWAGGLPIAEPGILAVNNANIGGHKSDQFIEQEIDHRVEIQGSGDVEGVVTIRRTHRGPSEIGDLKFPPDENPAYKDNVVYQRTFVPLNASLLEAHGFALSADVPSRIPDEAGIELEWDPDVAEWHGQQVPHPSGTIIGREGGYTFFANWMVTRPGETSVASYRYRLPARVRLPTVFDPAQRFRVFVVKQPGDMRTELRLEITVPKNVTIRRMLPDEGMTRIADNVVSFRSALIHDVIAGLVLERR